jgi:putative hemolysin
MCALSMATVLRFEPAARLVPIDDLPAVEIAQGKYLVRLARTQAEVAAALRLRFEVFNIECGEGPATSFVTGRNEDQFDSTSHHLILIDRSRRQVIGTFRLRTYEIAKTIEGFCSSTEFDLSALPLDIAENAIEVGRTCISKPHRNTRVLLLLWKGLALYWLHYWKRYFFGCSSLSSQDPSQGGRVFDLLSDEGHLHTEFRLNARTGFKCLWYKATDHLPQPVTVPNPLRTYLRFGGKLCGPPALDREHRTINFFVLLDRDRIDRRMHSILCGSVAQAHDFARSA